MKINFHSRVLAISALLGALACAGNSQGDTEDTGTVTTTRDTEARTGDSAMTDTTMTDTTMTDTTMSADSAAQQEAGRVTQTPGDSVGLTDTLNLPKQEGEVKNPPGYQGMERDTTMVPPDTTGGISDSAAVDRVEGLNDSTEMNADTASMSAPDQTGGQDSTLESSTGVETDTSGAIGVELDTTTNSPPQR